MDGMTMLALFVLSVFVGFEVVSKVSTTLHTPLMSGANAIHGVILVGAILVTGRTTSWLGLALGLLAVVLATVNMVGGFVVTDRMLEMFKGRSSGRRRGCSMSVLSANWTAFFYLVAAVCFILALKGLSSPGHGAARQPDRRRRCGAGGRDRVPVRGHGPRAWRSWSPSRSAARSACRPRGGSR